MNCHNHFTKFYRSQLNAYAPLGLVFNILPRLVVITGRSKIAFYLFQLSVLSSRALSYIYLNKQLVFHDCYGCLFTCLCLTPFLISDLVK